MSPHGNIQPVEFRGEEPRPRTADRLDSAKFVIVVGIPLLEHRDPTLSSNRVDSMTLLVVEDVVAVADCGQSRNPPTLNRVQHDEPSRKPGYDKQPMVLLVQGHWIVG